MIRLIPPIAVPVNVLQVASSLLPGRPPGDETFVSALGAAARSKVVHLFGSGRAALASYLSRVVREARDEVIVPAYTCWTVPAAVVRAGAKICPVDVDPLTFDLVPGALDAAITTRTAVVVTAHLLGPSADVEQVASTVRSKGEGIRVVEDAAQAWPPVAPTAADAVITSFGRGKPLPLGGGGAILTDEGTLPLGPAGARGGWLRAAKLAATSALSRPAWYRIPESIPQLGIGLTEYDPDFDSDEPFRFWQARLGTRLLGALPEWNRRRTEHARWLAERIGGLGGWTVPSAARNPAPLRLPVLASCGNTRDAMVAALRRRGVSASRMYPGTLLDIPGLGPGHVVASGDRPGARDLAERLLTLPVYPALRHRDRVMIGDAFEDAAGEVTG